MRVLDCTPEELADLVDHDCPVAIRLPGDTAGWFVLSAARHGKLLVTDHTGVGQWQRHSKVFEPLRLESNGQTIRCVIADKASNYEPDASAAAHGHAGHSMTPFARLRTLLRPELGDIWIVLIFAMFVGLLALASPIAVETLVTTLAFGRYLQPIVVLALLLLAFLLFAGGLRALQTYVVEIIQRRLFVRVAADLANRFPRIQHEAFDGVHPPELVNRFFDVITVQKISSTLLLDGVSLILQTMIGMLVLAFYHPWLLGFDIFLLVFIAFVLFVLGRGAVKASVRTSKAKYKLAAWLQEIARCTTTFKLDGGPEFAAEHASRLAVEYVKARRLRFKILLRQIMSLLFMQAVASTALLTLGGWLVIQKQLTLGQLVAAELIVAGVVDSLAKVGKQLEGFYDLLAGVDKLGVLLDLPVERRDGLLNITAESGARLKLHNVSYRYPDQVMGLRPINLNIAANTRLALVGPAGRGMSTLLDLLFGLRQPTTGHIEIDGIDPRDLRPDILRRHVALVRSVDIFDGTIAENIHMERPNMTIDDVRSALDRVNLLESVLALPKGLDTHLTSAGRPFSATEARLLVLARAFAGYPKLLLIDGLLDPLGDEDLDRISQKLFGNEPDCTVIIVSRRQQILQQCDAYFDLGTGETHANKETTETPITRPDQL